MRTNYTPKIVGNFLSTVLLALATCSATAKTNPFEMGWCTWAAAELFNAAAPDPGVNWTGDAGTWLAKAKAAGWETTTSRNGAEVGAIVVWIGNLGHVAVVPKTWRGGFQVTE